MAAAGRSAPPLSRTYRSAADIWEGFCGTGLDNDFFGTGEWFLWDRSDVFATEQDRTGQKLYIGQRSDLYCKQLHVL